MKVIITGITGLIGGEVLTQCLSNPAITSIVTLARRDIPTQHPKLKQIKHTDFLTYSPKLLAELAVADACIFCLGIAVPKTPEDGKRIDHDYPLATAKAFQDNATTKNFRFVYVSGALVEKDQDKKLWILSGMRKLRGRTELGLLKLNSEGKEIKIVRPGFVGSKEGGIKDIAMGVIAKLIKVDVLAKAIVDITVNGGKEIIEMDELISIGKSAKGGS